MNDIVRRDVLAGGLAVAALSSAAQAQENTPMYKARPIIAGFPRHFETIPVGDHGLKA